jgi:hypothetical protein
MPKLINPYGGEDNPIAAAISGLADSMFGDVAKRELVRQKALEARRENENVPLLADALERGDIQAALRYGVRAGAKGQDTAAWNLLGVSGRTKDIYDPNLSKAYVGAGHGFGQSPMGVQAAEANRVAIENERTRRANETALEQTNRTLAAADRRADNTPVNVMDGGVPRIVSQREAIARGMQPYDTAVATANQTPINIIDPDTQQPVVTSRAAAIASRARPVLGESDEKGRTFADWYASATPAQRASVHGAGDKQLTPYLYEWTSPDGKLYKGTAYATPGGPVDAVSGQALPQGVVMKKLEGENAGITGNPTADNRLVQLRAATKNATQSIDNIIADLQKPNAAASLGIVGRGAVLYSNARAQAEALTSAMGGETFGDVFSKPENVQAANAAVNKVFGDKNLAARLKQAGIDSARLRSQIMDLAYVVAKVQNPSGQIGKADVEHALATTGGALMDPRLMIPVLKDLKARTLQAQQAHEEAIQSVYPRSNVLPAPAAPGAQPAAPAMPVIKLDLDGNEIP